MTEPPPAGGEEPPVIDAKFFDTILESDLANIIRKATSGLPLNARERKMIEDERARLSQKTAPAVFTLEGEGPKSPLEGLNQAQLAERWGYSLRTIKGWIAAGREANDPCPLTRPAEMPPWFERIHAPRQCPDKLWEAVERLRTWLEGESVAAQPAAAPAGPPPELVEISEEAKGMHAMLDRLRTAEARLYMNYMAAVEAGNEQRAPFLRKEWSDVAEKLRALEKIAPETLEKLGLYVKKADVLREVEAINRAVVKTIRQELRLGRPKLRGAETIEDWNRISDEIVDRICGLLVESNFAEPLTFDDAA